MKVSDFIHGPSTIPLRLRQRNADLARVNVPVTRLDGSKYQSPNTQAANSGQRIEDVAQTEADLRLESKDMFDTDIEGVDDSTTTISLANNGYKSLAERIKELDSDDEYASDSTSIPFHNPPQKDAEIENQEQEIRLDDGEQNEKSNWNGDIPAPHRERLGWQKIEAILRAGNPQPANGVEEQALEHAPEYERVKNRSLPHDGVYHGPAAPETRYSNDARLENAQLASREILRSSTSGKFNTRSRFATNHSYYTANAQINNSGPTASHRITQPPSVPTTRPSAGKKPWPPVNGYADTQYHNETHFPIIEQISNHNNAIFDTATELSVLDSSHGSEESQHQDFTTINSPRLSTTSHKSSRHTSFKFVSDYPPDILESKSFSDLQSESFDYNPAPVQPIFPPQDPPVPIADNLSRLKSLTGDQRRTFFSTLSLTEWEEGGDWLIDQFGLILKRTKIARQTRRKVASTFEEDIQRRYDNLNSEAESLDKKLDEMRTGGIGVLKGQSP